MIILRDVLRIHCEKPIETALIQVGLLRGSTARLPRSLIYYVLSYSIIYEIRFEQPYLLPFKKGFFL
jgi:hypothetical protein